MQISVKKNVWLRRLTTGHKVMITDIIDYEGKKEFVFVLQTGFGVNEVKTRETIPYHKMKYFMADFKDFSKETITKPILEKVTTPTTMPEIENEIPTVLEKNQDNFDEMRKILFETMRDLKDGKIKSEIAREIHNTAQTIINTVKVELDYEKIAKVSAKSKMVS